MRIVHLALDEKVVPLARSVFEEAYPGANTYLVCRRPRHPPRFLLPDANVRYRHRLAFRFPFLLWELRGADMVVVHGMTRKNAKALRAAPSSALVVWIGFGFDYTGLFTGQLGSFWLEQTEALLDRLGIDKAKVSNIDAPIRSVASRIDVFSVNPSEVQMLRTALPALKGLYHPLPSYTVEDVLEQGAAHMTGPDVLVGNSAHQNNNHLEALAVLRAVLPAGSRVIVPLSYGDPRYADAVEAAGREMFGHRFVALRNWMPIAEYHDSIASCGTVLMQHRQQQGVGNIVAALYKGARVFLLRCNPLFGFFTELGVTVRAIEALADDPGLLQRAASPAEQAANRQAIRHRFGRDAVVARVKDLATLRTSRQPSQD
jgi:dTDP-N-acetylfucosamine:lipid II N-acetylfucosaminyltransferase